MLLTTVRLWAQRRKHLRWPAQARWRVLTLLVVAAVLFAAGAISIALTSSPAPAGHARGGGTQAAAARAPTPAAIAAAAAARTAAARWIASQVSAAAIVSCDPQMCAQLQVHGIPAAQLLTLGGSNPAPLGSDLIVSTAAVRSEFGARLSSVYAPAVLATFGTGTAQTAVRVVAADGGAAYLRSLRTDVAARAAAGSQLLQNPRLHSSASARRALAAGQVDSRLLTAFAALATMHVVDVVGFPASAAGASAGMPLRTADIAPARPGTPAGPTRSAPWPATCGPSCSRTGLHTSPSSGWPVASRYCASNTARPARSACWGRADRTGTELNTHRSSTQVIKHRSSTLDDSSWEWECMMVRSSS